MPSQAVILLFWRAPVAVSWHFLHRTKSYNIIYTKIIEFHNNTGKKYYHQIVMTMVRTVFGSINLSYVMALVSADLIKCNSAKSLSLI